MLASLIGIDIAGYLILLFRIPFVFPKERKLAGEITDGLQVTVDQTQDCIRLHQGNRRKDVIGDITAAVNDDIRSNVSQTL